MDGYDRKIISILRANGRISNIDLAREINLTPSATLKRVRSLEQRNIITGYTLRTDPRALEYELHVLIEIFGGEKIGSIQLAEKIADMPGVCDIYDVAGRSDYIIRAMFRNTTELNDFLSELGRAGVARCQTTLILRTHKNELSPEVQE